MRQDALPGQSRYLSTGTRLRLAPTASPTGRRVEARAS
jgi:hypothetical protein